jgi:hypothetical protein
MTKQNKRSQQFNELTHQSNFKVIQFNSIQLIFINVPSQRSDSQRPKQQNTETQTTMDNKQDTYETKQNKQQNIYSLITHNN